MAMSFPCESDARPGAFGTNALVEAVRHVVIRHDRDISDMARDLGAQRRFCGPFGLLPARVLA